MTACSIKAVIDLYASSSNSIDSIMDGMPSLRTELMIDIGRTSIISADSNGLLIRKYCPKDDGGNEKNRNDLLDFKKEVEPTAIDIPHELQVETGPLSRVTATGASLLSRVYLPFSTQFVSLHLVSDASSSKIGPFRNLLFWTRIVIHNHRQRGLHPVNPFSG
jgi:hypothetical protein